MPFEKGKEKTGGRQKGTPNKATGIKAKIDAFLSEQHDKFLQEMQLLSGKDYVNAYLKMLDYSIPKLTRSATSVNFNDLTESEVEELFERLKNEVKQSAE